MIRCSECGYIGEYRESLCPRCGKAFRLSDAEIAEKEKEIKNAISQKTYELAVEGYHILADQGITEAQREYASILERGEWTEADPDGAMKYFFLAAEKNDATSAYRFSRLAERTSSAAADFWLSYSAVLGCIDAFLPLASRLSDEGRHEEANYYYSLAAMCDSTDAIVTMAKRYYNGIGVEKNDTYAKWYLDKLFIPPFHAIKMAYKLRSVKPNAPEEPRHPDYDRLLRRLAVQAHDLKFYTAYHRLCSIMSDRGDIKARGILGLLYADGVGCKQDIRQGLDLLSDAAVHGNADAYKELGDIYLSGRLTPPDSGRALECYRGAARLGMTNAYETMGDIFCDGTLVEQDFIKAVECYDLAAKEGHESARDKAEKIRADRLRLYNRGRESELTHPHDAFRCYAVSAGMGYIPSYTALGRCFEEGIGTDVDRKQGYIWYKKAAEAKDEPAFVRLGLCYSRGIGTAFDIKKALKALSRAARLGDKAADGEIRRLLNSKMSRLSRASYSKGMELIYNKKFGEAERVLVVCLKTGHAKGIYTLGCMHEFGLGVPTNRELAFRLYEEAFRLKFRDPRAEYKLKILRMARNYK